MCRYTNKGALTDTSAVPLLTEMYISQVQKQEHTMKTKQCVMQYGRHSLTEQSVESAL